ncbi:hypothetical protein OH492_21180 [Vibrio chagasii]|nr:hypothetical protein [Vibrio chagasii]
MQVGDRSKLIDVRSINGADRNPGVRVWLSMMSKATRLIVASTNPGADQQVVSVSTLMRQIL